MGRVGYPDGVTSLDVEIEGGDRDAPGLGGPAQDLLAFCSFTFMLRFGSVHELSLLGRRLKERYKLDLRTFTTYGEGRIRVDEDVADKEKLWQDAGEAAAAARAVIEVMDSGDAQVAALVADWPALRGQIEAFATRCEWARDRQRRIRLTFSLDENEREGDPSPG